LNKRVGKKMTFELVLNHSLNKLKVSLFLNKIKIKIKVNLKINGKKQVNCVSFLFSFFLPLIFFSHFLTFFFQKKKKR